MYDKPTPKQSKKTDEQPAPRAKRVRVRDLPLAVRAAIDEAIAAGKTANVIYRALGLAERGVALRSLYRWAGERELARAGAMPPPAAREPAWFARLPLATKTELRRRVYRTDQPAAVIARELALGSAAVGRRVLQLWLTERRAAARVQSAAAALLSLALVALGPRDDAAVLAPESEKGGGA